MTTIDDFIDLECTRCGWLDFAMCEFEDHADTGPARRLAEEHDATHPRSGKEGSHGQ